MKPVTLWLLIAVGGLTTFALRYSLIGLLGRAEFPPALRRALRYVPPAVLTAIIAPALLAPDGQVDLSLANARLLAGTAAILIALLTRRTLLTLLVGMAVLWLLGR